MFIYMYINCSSLLYTALVNCTLMLYFVNGTLPILPRFRSLCVLLLPYDGWPAT